MNNKGSTVQNTLVKKNRRPQEEIDVLSEGLIKALLGDDYDDNDGEFITKHT